MACRAEGYLSIVDNKVRAKDVNGTVVQVGTSNGGIHIHLEGTASEARRKRSGHRRRNMVLVWLGSFVALLIMGAIYARSGGSYVGAGQTHNAHAVQPSTAIPQQTSAAATTTAALRQRLPTSHMTTSSVAISPVPPMTGSLTPPVVTTTPPPTTRPTSPNPTRVAWWYG